MLTGAATKSSLQTGGNYLTKGQPKCWNSSNVPYQLTYVYHDCAWTQVMMDWDGLLSMYSPWTLMSCWSAHQLDIDYSCQAFSWALSSSQRDSTLHVDSSSEARWDIIIILPSSQNISLTAAGTLKREYEAEKEHASESSQSSISYISYTNKALPLSRWVLSAFPTPKQPHGIHIWRRKRIGSLAGAENTQQRRSVCCSEQTSSHWSALRKHLEGCGWQGARFEWFRDMVRHGHPTRPCVPEFVSKAYWHARIILWELASDRNLYNFYCKQTC